MKKKRIRRKVPWTKAMSEEYSKALREGIKKAPPRKIVSVHPATKEEIING